MDLTHKEKDELIMLTKKALELACYRLGCFDGLDSESADPEYWIGRAYLTTQTKGWNNDTGI